MQTLPDLALDRELLPRAYLRKEAPDQLAQEADARIEGRRQPTAAEDQESQGEASAEALINPIVNYTKKIIILVQERKRCNGAQVHTRKRYIKKYD